MADIELVIKIDEKLYSDMKSLPFTTFAEDVIINGTPLPKGHGRLIDADELKPRDISPEAWYSPMWGFELFDIEDAPTIIEADAAESEEV